MAVFEVEVLCREISNNKRQFVITLARSVIERASDYKKVEGYINDMLS